MSYLDSGEFGLGASYGPSQTMAKVEWEGGRPGDVNEEGIPYGTFEYLVPAMKAHADEDKARIAKMTAPWANIFGSESENPLGLSTPVLALGVVGAVVGLFFLKKKLKKRKAGR